MPKYRIVYVVEETFETYPFEADDPDHAREIFLSGEYEAGEDKSFYSELQHDSVDVLLESE